MMPSTGYEDDRYALNSALIAPLPIPVKIDASGVERRPSPWAGQSGAALLTGEEHIVLGLVISDPAAFPTGRIEAVRITALMEDPSFAALVNPKGRQIEGIPSEGIEYPNGVVDHREEISGLIGIAANLRSEQLPFVAPNDTSPAHPDQILTQLEETAGESGILLLGPAGAGKTRVCLEVGDRALSAGWTVLHVKPGEPHVTTDQLISVLDKLANPRVLLIIDYINECHGLDFPAIRHRLLRKAASRGTRVAFLASARPGWYFHPESYPARTLFKALDISPDAEHEGRIRRQIASSLAPTAVPIIGKNRFFELCGRRPIIAMLIAVEAETLAKEGKLSSIGGVRPGQLLDWLTRRLNEDDRLLSQEKQGEHSNQASSIAMQACAAMTAAMPQDRADVIACGTKVCNQDDEQAEHLLGALLRMGWVISTPVGLATVHDIVADQLLERTAIIPLSNAVRRDATSLILSGCLTRGRTVGRYASNIGRLLRDLDIDGRAESLSRFCETWFSEHVVQLGEIFGVYEDEGSYALGAAIDNPAWGQNIFNSWGELVGPWLTRHGRSLSARHLLYKGLKAVGPSHVKHLVSESLAWLECRRTSLEAGFVLGPLLGCDLEKSAAAQTVEHTLSWLRQHGTTIEGGFVLAPLLGCALEGDPAAQAVEHALSWLRQHGTTIEGGFVLAPLLGCALEGDPAAQAVEHALSWLRQHGTTIEGGFVLAPLLGCALEGDPAAQAVEHALSWLRLHESAQEARFVLGPLLGCALEGDPAAQAVEHALSWLRLHESAQEAQFVLGPLLGCALEGDPAAQAVEHTLSWLRLHESAQEAQFVLGPLLGCALEGDPAAQAVEHTLSWLRQHGTTIEGGFVLAPLLGCALEGDPAAQAVEHTLSWLRQHGTTIEAGFVLPPLLANYRAVNFGTAFLEDVERWISSHSMRSDVGFVAKHLGRQGLITTRMAALIIKGILDNPGAEDVAWRLTAVAKSIESHPLIAKWALIALEAHFSEGFENGGSVNARAEMDSLLEKLCRLRIFCCGISAARLDDVLQIWIFHPAALKCSPGSYYSATVSRVAAMVRSGRFSSNQSKELVAKMRSWTSGWECGPENEGWQRQSQAILETLRIAID
ncbi:hypothetical protein [Streptomyces himastatinicus]|uniref:hypothetical protein n=1 Tax=Streptomyces himastatinicus TaxID=998084 RepID=UPI0012B68747|nr:hypothetical protein [Streptomyces himastatinicus]